jgi:hypothetical protein
VESVRSWVCPHSTRTGDKHATELDHNNWDFVEAGPTEGRNSWKATSLFVCGAIDHYQLSVFDNGAAMLQWTVSRL